MRRVYPHADGVRVASGNVVTVFNFGGNKYRLIALVNFVKQILLIDQVFTHEEYNRKSL